MHKTKSCRFRLFWLQFAKYDDSSQSHTHSAADTFIQGCGCCRSVLYGISIIASCRRRKNKYSLPYWHNTVICHMSTVRVRKLKLSLKTEIETEMLVAKTETDTFITRRPASAVTKPLSQERHQGHSRLIANVSLNQYGHGEHFYLYRHP